MRPGELVVWFLFQGKSFDVGMNYGPAGKLSGYYIDALRPVNWSEDQADTPALLVDLFLDLWVWTDGEYEILDMDELQEAVNRHDISAQEAQLARATIESIVQGIVTDQFPYPTFHEYHLTVADVGTLTSALERAA